MPDARIEAVLTADTRPYEQSMDKAADATSKVETAQKKVEAQSRRTQFAMIALSTAAAAAGAAIVVQFRQGIQAAAALSSSTDQMKQVFGGASKEVEKFADVTKNMSRRAVYDATSAMGQLGKAAGLSGRELSTFSTRMVALSQDLAAFKSTSPEQAIQAVEYALRGQYAAIGQYGVLLNDATLRQRAFEMSLISTTTQALTPQQKVLAAQAEIMAQTTDAQGALARSADDLSTAQQRFAAASEDAKAVLGEALAPAMVAATNAGADLLEVFADLPEPVQEATTAILALLAAVSLAAPAVKLLGQAMSLLLPAKLLALGSTLGPIAAALTGVAAAAWGVHQSAEYQRGKGVEALTQQMLDAQSAATALSETLSVTLGGGRVITGVEELFDSLKNGSDLIKGQIAPAFESLDSYLANLPSGQAADAFAEVKAAASDVGISVGELNALLPEYTSMTGDASGAQADVADTAALEAQAIDEARQAIESTMNALYGYINAQRAVADNQQDLFSLESDLRAGMFKTTQTGTTGSKARSAANDAEAKSVQRTIDALRKRDAAEVAAEIERARRAAKRRAEERADKDARTDVRKGVAKAIATDKAARRGEDIDGFNQTGTVREYTGQLSDSDQRALDKKIDGIRARHKKALDAQIKGLRDTVTANRAAAAATSKAAETVTTYSNSLDASTAAGQHNLEMLRDKSKVIDEAGKAAYDQAIADGKSAQAAQRIAGEAMLEARRGFLDAAESAGFARDEVRKYLNLLGLIPKKIATTFDVNLNTTKAERDLAKYKTKLDNIMETEARSYDPGSPVRKPVAVIVPKGARYAAGGEVYGSGTSRSDSVLIAASRGEYVVNAQQYAANRELVRAINAGSGKVAAGGMTIGQVNVTEASPSGVRVSVIDALAEAAYRGGRIR